MSLYGALFSGVSGLRSQSNSIGLISDNISNVNTVGYKSGQGIFQTLVTTASGTTTYSPGGVLPGNRQNISKQGLLQSTDSPTDIAISGSGFFVVNQAADGTGNVLYTRAGSFTEDSLGNYRNTAGFFLQAWPLDRNGLLPGEPGNTNTVSSANLASLTTVNVAALTGSASPTTSVSLSANLNAAQSAFLGAEAIVTMNNQHSVNYGISANSIIIPGGANGLIRSDAFTITSNGGVNSTYTYGGFTFSRQVSDGLNGDAGGPALGAGTVTLGANPLATTNSSTTVTVTHNAHGFSNGQVVTLSGVPGAINGVPAADFNNVSFVISNVTLNTYDIVVATTATGTGSGGGAAVVEDSRPFIGNILDATTVTQTFLGTTGTSGFTSAGLTFTITTAATGTSTFTYSASTPNAQLGEFNNMTNLASAINAVTGLTARVDTTTGQLYVSATDATQAITFANGSTVGSSGPPVQAGIDWVTELGLVNISAASGAGAQRFSTMTGLNDLIEATSGLDATISNPLGTSSVTINLSDPLGTITFTDDVAGGSLLTELGFFGNVAQNTQQTLGPLGPSYDPNDSTKNMASGSTTPQFSRQLQIFDALGASHSITMAFLKLGINTWAVEVYAVPATDVNSPDGVITNGTVTFNGDGTLLSVDSSLTNPVTIQWQNTGSDPTTVTFGWGTAGPPGTGGTDGLSQFSSNFRVNFVNQNGAPVGDLTNVIIDEDGFITANYSNGQTQRLYKIPLGRFANPNQLSSITGNAYAQSANSGEVNLTEAGVGGSGTIAPASLEASNVELAEQLTDLIIAQRSYQAMTKIISTSDTLLNDLNQILR